MMIAYVGLGLEQTGTTVIPNIWFGIAASRILRKVCIQFLSHVQFLIFPFINLLIFDRFGSTL